MEIRHGYGCSASAGSVWISLNVSGIQWSWLDNGPRSWENQTPLISSAAAQTELSFNPKDTEHNINGNSLQNKALWTMPWGNVDECCIPKAFECPPGQELFNELLFRKRNMRHTTKWRGAFFVVHYMPSLCTLLCLLPLCEIGTVNLNTHCSFYGRVQMTSANVSKSYYGWGKRRTEENLLQVKSSVCPIVILNYFKSVQMNWAKREIMWGDCEGVHPSTCEDLQSIMSDIKTHLFSHLSTTSEMPELQRDIISPRIYSRNRSSEWDVHKDQTGPPKSWI